MKIFVSAGGTGGHVFPALEFIKLAMTNGHTVYWFGTKRGIERNNLPANCHLFEINAVGYRGKRFLQKIFSIFRLVQTIFEVAIKFIKYKPKKVLCFGGYVSLPVGLVAVLFRVPIYLHEQNTVLGTANKILLKFAKKCFLGLPLIDTQNSGHFELTGNPIRKILLEPDQEYDTASIYITGGSQGANYLNDVIPKALNKVNHRLRVVHQAGKGSSELVINTYLKNKFDLLVVKDFFDNPFAEIQKADFVISRSGALSVSEITSLNKGSLYIPIAKSIDDHQLHNAKYAVGVGMGEIFSESESLDDLIDKLNEIIEQRSYLSWQKNSDIDHSQAAEKIYNHIFNYD